MDTKETNNLEKQTHNIDTNTLKWHNYKLTSLIRDINNYHPLLTIIKAITPNAKQLHDKMVNGGSASFGVKTLQVIGKKLNCKVLIAFMPLEPTDETLKLEYAIEFHNAEFYKLLETGLYQYCSDKAEAPPINTKVADIDMIRQLSNDLDMSDFNN